ncbi:MAG: hypothetical protein AAF791_06320 [Bacteroidota bacterium]
MRTVASLILLFVAALGAQDVWAAAAPESAPPVETHMPFEAEVEVETEAQAFHAGTEAGHLDALLQRPLPPDARSLIPGVPPTPPPES